MKQYSEEIIEISVRFLGNTEVKKYFLPAIGRTIKNEQELTDDMGNLLRMDRVIIDEESVTVMDFKTGKKETDENNYKRQLRKYMKILREIYPDKSIKRRGSATASIIGVIAYVDLVEVRSVS